MNRKLGTSERFALLCDQVGSITFVSIAHLSGSLDEHALRSALDLLPQRHPLLRTRIEVIENEPVLTSENVSEIPFRVEVRRGDDHWLSETEEEINNPLPWFTGPLVRVVLLKSSDTSELLVTFCHVIGDGISGVYLMRDLLNLVGQITEGNTPEIEPFPERPPLADLLPKTTRGVRGSVKTAILLGKTLLNFARRPKKLPRDGDPFSEDRRARIIHCILPREKTEALITQCHEESTTVHGAICAAILKAAAQQICSALPDTKSITINCLSAVNLRPFFNPPLGDEVGHFISWAITPHRISEDTRFWDLARNISKAVHASIRKSEPFVFVSLLDKFTPKDVTPDNFAKQASNIYSASILVTNLGRFDMPERYGPFTLQKVHFAGANKAFSEYFNIDISTYCNTLNINFAYTDPTISPTRAAALAEDIMKTLQSVSHPG